MWFGIFLFYFESAVNVENHELHFRQYQPTLACREYFFLYLQHHRGFSKLYNV